MQLTKLIGGFDLAPLKRGIEIEIDIERAKRLFDGAVYKVDSIGATSISYSIRKDGDRALIFIKAR